LPACTRGRNVPRLGLTCFILALASVVSAPVYHLFDLAPNLLQVYDATENSAN
jgi:hypothetical protein